MRIAISGSHSLGKSTVVNDWVASRSGYTREEEPYRALSLHDRAPVDYLAYSQYTADSGTTDIDDAFVQSMVPAVRESLDHFDLLAFVPCSEQWPVAMEEDGIRPVDHSYRDAVDAIFKQICRAGRFGVMPGKNAPRLIELCGSRERRPSRTPVPPEAYDAVKGKK